MDQRNIKSEFEHIPVMLDEVIEYLQPASNKNLLDVTFGRGGHCSEILKITAPDGKAFATDADATAVEFCETQIIPKFDGRIQIFHSWFSGLGELLADNDIEPVDMLLADLGLSSPQIDDATRGFSYMADGPLDMRFNANAGKTALQLLIDSHEKKLAQIFWEYGDERFSRQIAREIKIAVKSRSLKTTLDLAELIKKTVSRAGKGRIRDNAPAPRRVFQALRIAINDEFAELESLLEILPKLLKSEGRVAIISFHSLEDRLVKLRFKELAKTGEFEILTKKPITATPQECRSNSRSASAKLRILQKL